MTDTTTTTPGRPGRRPGDPRNVGGWGTGRFPKQPASPNQNAEADLAAAQAAVTATAAAHRLAVVRRNDLIRRLHDRYGYPVARLGDVLRKGDPTVSNDVARKVLR